MKSQNMVMKLRSPSPATMLITVFFRSNFPEFSITMITKENSSIFEMNSRGLWNQYRFFSKFTCSPLDYDDELDAICLDGFFIFKYIFLMIFCLTFFSVFISIEVFSPCRGSSSPPHGNVHVWSSSHGCPEAGSCIWNCLEYLFCVFIYKS